MDVQDSSHPDQILLKGKKGAAFTLRGEGCQGSWAQNLPRVLSLHPYWNYSWGIQRLSQDLQPKSINFLPMIWGYNEEAIEAVLTTIKAQSPTLVLTFNEPDNIKQSNIPVETALQVWPKLEGLQIALVSPSCVNAKGDWMSTFMKEAKARNLRIDVIGFHDYGGGNARFFKELLEDIRDRYRRPILITEFAVADWKAKTPSENKHKPKDVLKFMQGVLPWLEKQDWIVGYSWFSFDKRSAAGTSSALFEHDGSLTELGAYYARFKPNLTPT